MLNVWQNVLDDIERVVPHASFSTWFKGVTLLSTEGGGVVIGVPNIFYIQQFEVKYNTVITKALRDNGIEFEKISYVINDTAPRRKVISREVTKETLKTADRVKAPEVRGGSGRGGYSATDNGLNQRYRFDNFVVGSNNDLAVSAAKAVVDNPGARYNPYFIYGGPGLGKTHLIQAIGNEIVKNNTKMKVLYITIEQFYHAFVEAMRGGTGNEFSRKYRGVDVLIIDDFQLIVGKEKSQDEFFHTFNDLYQNNKQIIVSSDRLPSQIATVDQRLSSRLMAGIPIDIQMPDFETRCAILKSKAEFTGVQIENDAIEYLANNIKTNIRELEGKFNQLVALSELRNMSPQEVIDEGYLTDSQMMNVKAISPKQIIDKTAKFFQLTPKEISSESRSRHVVVPRQIAMFLLSEELGMSTPKICVELGRKDHTTAMHSIKKVKEDMKLNFGLREQIAAIRERLYGNL
jgi:chromosomal replication initiator protein